MRRFKGPSQILSIVLFSILLLILVGCSGGQDKIPTTTLSSKALELFEEGQDLAERLRNADAHERFTDAVTEDPDLAIAYLYMALTAPSPKLYFEYLDRARLLVENISEAERLIILSVEAGSHANPMQQREYLKSLVELYPDDERAHFWLASHYFGQQDYTMVIEEAGAAKDINKRYSPPYNLLGYAYRYLGDYENAEKAFQKYIELIPDDPNPYDSYADLLMKMGKYGESIESYYKALQLDETFAASHFGIASNLNFLDKHKDAREQLMEYYDLTDAYGQRRDALLAMAISFMDEGRPEDALEVLDKRFVLSQKNNDAAAMAGDLAQKAAIYVQIGKAAKARGEYELALKIIEDSDLSEEIKANSRRIKLYNDTRVALIEDNIELARELSIEFRKQVDEINHPNLIKASHQLAGMIALDEENYDMAIAEFRQSNQLNPYNFYLMAQAYQGKEDIEKTKEWLIKTVEFNDTNNMLYAFVRKRAKALLSELGNQN